MGAATVAAHGAAHGAPRHVGRCYRACVASPAAPQNGRTTGKMGPHPNMRAAGQPTARVDMPGSVQCGAV
eukprot:scaffold12381_cov117-Isochrysis_galbana.AAC.3